MDSSPSLCIFGTSWGGLQYRDTRATKNWLKIQGRQVKLGRGWGQEVIFDDYQISSQNDDRIAFTVDLTLLSRALKSSVSMDGDKLLVKLVRKRPSLAEGRLPYLTFESKVCSHRSNHLCWLWQFCTCPKQSTEVLLLKFQFLRATLLWNSDHTVKCVLWQGHRSAIIQDVPISQPLNRIDVQELQSSLDMAQALPRVPTKLMLLSGQLWVLCCVDLARSPGWVVTFFRCLSHDSHIVIQGFNVWLRVHFKTTLLLCVEPLCDLLELHVSSDISSSPRSTTAARLGWSPREGGWCSWSGCYTIWWPPPPGLHTNGVNWFWVSKIAGDWSTRCVSFWGAAICWGFFHLLSVMCLIPADCISCVNAVLSFQTWILAQQVTKVYFFQWVWTHRHSSCRIPGFEQAFLSIMPWTMKVIISFLSGCSSACGVWILKVAVNGYLKFQDLDIQVSFMVFPAEPSSSEASSSTRRLQLALQKEEASAVVWDYFSNACRSTLKTFFG